MVGGPDEVVAASTIPIEDRIGRMGVTYVRALLAQAGIGNQETTSGEDHLSVDLLVEFRQAPVRVQVKAGRKRRNKDATFSVATTPKWRNDWTTAKIPVYLVYVHLEQAKPVRWVDHPKASTTVHGHAHWLRVNGLSVASARVPIANRLTVDTFSAWERDVEAAFGKAATA